MWRRLTTRSSKPSSAAPPVPDRLVTREFDLTHTIGSIAELLRQTCR
jgi:hypothetical protein